jgi:hypothetical protein
MTRLELPSRRSSVMLAAGDGSRLRSLSRRIAGDERPKQFCDMLGSVSTLLHHTANRVGRNVSQDQIAYVVTRAHERYYKLLEAVCIRGVFSNSQPILLSIFEDHAIRPICGSRDIPSDRYFSDEAVYIQSMLNSCSTAVLQTPFA